MTWASPTVSVPSATTPARTRELFAGAPTHFHADPLRRGRPDLANELRRGGLRPLAVEELAGRRAEQALELARDAMVTRGRDLDAFAYGSAEDVRLVTWEDGLQFAVIGVRPERRLLLEAVYAFLTLKNGVPAGYVLNSALFGSAEIAFNVFEAFRGVAAAQVYARVLATVQLVFSATAFTIFPYQLGDGNDEALDSGAWWFYQKLGFRPRDPRAVALMQRELARQRRDPSSRSTRATLAALSRENLFLHLGKERRDVIGEVPLPWVGVAATALLARRFASADGPDDRGDRGDRGGKACAVEARARLGLRSFAGWSAARARRLPPLGAGHPPASRPRALEPCRAVGAGRGRPRQGRAPGVGVRAALRCPPEAAARSGEAGAGLRERLTAPEGAERGSPGRLRAAAYSIARGVDWTRTTPMIPASVSSEPRA